MNNVLMLLLVAGLVVGVAFVSGTLTDTGTVPREGVDEPAVERLPEETETEMEERQLEQEEVESTYEREEGAISGDIQSLDFKVDVTTDENNYTSRFRIMRPGSDDEDIRIDTTRDDGAEMTIILKGSTDEGWVNDYSSDEWTHFTGVGFTQLWQTRSNQYLAYRTDEWKSMEGQEFTVENEGGPDRVYDIRVNEGIPESVFSPS